MKPRTFVFAAALALAGCHHGDRARTTPAPQPDFKPPHAMAARNPLAPSNRPLAATSYVFFDSGSESLSPQAQQDLDAAAAWLVAHPSEHILVQGHTDSTGSTDYNMQLSFRRGVAVADYLAARGVPRDRIAIDPEGEKRASKEASQADRRAIIYATGPAPAGIR
jgi:peptidoglycan-associated lipoprotein